MVRLDTVGEPDPVPVRVVRVGDPVSVLVPVHGLVWDPVELPVPDPDSDPVKLLLRLGVELQLGVRVPDSEDVVERVGEMVGDRERLSEVNDTDSVSTTEALCVALRDGVGL